MDGNKSSEEPDIRKQIMVYILLARVIGSYTKSRQKAYKSLIAETTNYNHHQQYAKYSPEPEVPHISTCTADKLEATCLVNSVPNDIFTRMTFWYCRFSTCTLIIMLAKSILPLKYILELLFDLEMPANCYIPGRMVAFYPFLLTPASIILSSLHLYWRWSQHDVIRPKTFNLFSFMLEPYWKVERYYNTLDRGCDLASCTNNIHDVYLRNLLCYKVSYMTTTKYRLRANRTRAARLEMRNLINKSIIFVSTLFAILFIVFFPGIMFNITSDIWYTSSYPGCDIGLEQSHRGAHFRGGWSFTWTKHRCYVIVFDFVDSMIVWLDSGYALTFVLTICYLMNHDLTSYWRLMHNRLQIIYNHKFRMGKQYEHSNLKTSRYGREEFILNYGLGDERTQQLLSQLNGYDSKLIAESHFSEDMVNEIQWHISDCFSQIEASNLLISDIISIMIVFWFILNAVISCFKNYLNFSSYIRYLQITIFIGFSLVGSSLLNLYKCTRGSYNLICSFMAKDQSRYKRRFIRILDFYTKRNCTTYTLMGRLYLVVPTSNLIFIGWTLSCSIILENLVR